MAIHPAAELDAQYRLLREEVGLLERPGRVLIEVRGTEGAEFLQGQLTNEIETLEPGAGCYAALLDRKGKMRADMRLLRLAADRISLETDVGAAEEVFRHLNTYRVGRDAEPVRLDELTVLSLIGPRTPELLGGVPLGAEDSHRPLRLAETDVRAVTTLEGADLILAADRLPAVLAELTAAGAELVAETAAEVLRVEAGRPRFGIDMGNETIPQEAGLNERAVSFEKGCYIGQETVARLHYRGKPNRHLRRLRSERALAAGDAVALDGKELGRVGTAVLSPARGPLALAILRREAEPEAEVEVAGERAVVEAIEA